MMILYIYEKDQNKPYINAIRRRLNEQYTDIKEILVDKKQLNSRELLGSAVTKIREQGKPGQWKELVIPPILETERGAWNFWQLSAGTTLKETTLIERINVTLTKEEKLIHIKQQKTQKSTLKKLKELTNSKKDLVMEATINVQTLRLTKAMNQDKLLNDLVEGMNTKEATAFIIGVRLARHSDALKMKELKLRIEDIIKNTDKFAKDEEEELMY
jgi:hypothetical protein